MGDVGASPSFLAQQVASLLTATFHGEADLAAALVCELTETATTDQLAHVVLQLAGGMANLINLVGRFMGDDPPGDGTTPAGQLLLETVNGILQIGTTAA